MNKTIFSILLAVFMLSCIASSGQSKPQSVSQVISVEVSRQVVEELKRAGGTPRYTEYPETNHNSWTKAYREPEMIKWLFDQSREVH